MVDTVPESLIQLCETHPDRAFKVGRPSSTHASGAGEGRAMDTQDQTPRWNLTTHSIQPRHPLAAWLWLNDPLFRVSPDQLRQRMLLDAITEWQIRCSTLDFPRTLSKKKALEGFGSLKPDLQQAKAAMIAIERYNQDNPLLWVLWNEVDKTLQFLDDKAFPRDGGYRQIWIIRAPTWDRLWDASAWSSRDLVKWIETQEDRSFTVEWPLLPSSETQKAMAAQYEKMGFSSARLSKEVLRQKLSRAVAILKLVNADTIM